MKPIDLGYQQARGVGNASFEFQPGQSIEPETRALRANRIPNALNQAQQSFQYPSYMLQDMFGKGAGVATSLGTSLGTSLVPISTITPTSSLATTLASTTGGKLLSGGGMLAAQSGANMAQTGLGQAVQQGLSKTASSATSAGSGALGTIGTVAGGIGTVLGGLTMANQIGDAGSHRSAQDMLNTVSRSTHTTDQGNQYEQLGGVNSGAELAYENEMSKQKQLGFGINSIGTGASLGGLIGGTALSGTVGGPLGMAIGAGLGLLAGGIASIFGFGGNSDEIERLTRLTNDNIAMYNRQQESVGKSKDVAAEFNNRQGISSAKDGKCAYGPMKSIAKYNSGKNYSVGPHGISSKKGSLLEGQEVDWDTNPQNPEGIIVPGKPNGDNVLSSTTPYNSDVVISNKNPYIQEARNIVKDQDRLNKIIANASGSKEQQALQISQAEQMKQLNNEKMKRISMYNPVNLQQKKYKNGKLPGFKLGTIADYALATLPHLGSVMTNIMQYNRAKHADTYAPSTYVENGYGRKALEELSQLRFDPSQYLNDALRAYNQANYQADRMPGLGAGGQAILRNTNLQSYLNSLASIRTKQNEADNAYKTAYANALSEYGSREQAARIADNVQRFNWQQQQNAAKEGWMAQYLQNRDMGLLNMAADYLRMNQYNKAQDIENKKIGLWEQQNRIDDKKTNAYINNLSNSYNTYNLPNLIKSYETINDAFSKIIPTAFGNIIMP